jgi:hypothetical protein
MLLQRYLQRCYETPIPRACIKIVHSRSVRRLGRQMPSDATTTRSAVTDWRGCHTAGRHLPDFLHTLFSHGNISNVARQMRSGYRKESDYDHIRPEHREGFSRGLQGFRRMTLADLEHSERLAWGSPKQVRDSLIELAESLGAGALMLNFYQGAMPHEMFVQNLQRFGNEVLPAVQAHAVTSVPIA